MLERARQRLAEGRIDEGAECVDRLERLAAQYPAPADCAWSDIHRYAALGRAYVASAEERFDDAILVLTGLHTSWRRYTISTWRSGWRTRLAIVRFRARQVAEALGSFTGILTKFAQAGIHYPILDEGAEVGPLLAAFQEKAERSGNSSELTSYLSNLVAIWRSRYQSEPQQIPTSAHANSLSARETDILKLIGEGLSNKEIARNLAIAPETVKSHVKNIFSKLDVERRAQAVSRAQSLGLASTDR